MVVEKESQPSKIKVKQTSSAIRRFYKQRLHLKALGLRRLNHVVEVVDNACTRGLIRKVAHMVKIVVE